MKINNQIKSYVASIFISFIEWFEFLVFAYIFVQIFNSTTDLNVTSAFQKIGILLSFFARPIGAFIFGKLSVTKGRIPSLLNTLNLMIISSSLIIIATILKENLYLLLLQKREEAGINMAITQPSVKVLEYASNGYKVAPNNNSIYLIALIIGIGIPLLLLFIKFYFDTKIHNKIDVKNIVKDIPIIGEIPYIKDDKYIQSNDRSILAEAYRNVRTNINYLLPAQNKKEGYVIFSTSSIKGEGKTFNAINMALIMTQMKKKVLIVGADLRNPQLHKYIGLAKEKVGLTNYLFDQEVEIESIINKNTLDNQYLDTIISGSIPPNPAELISNGRFEKLLNIVKAEYDFIIVDSAPTLLVTDTLLITNLADLVIYVTRADMTDKHVVEYSRDLYLQGKISKIAYIVNSVGLIYVYGYKYKYNYSYGYGYNYNYGYGYGYGSEEDNDYIEKSTFEKMISKFKDTFKS